MSEVNTKKPKTVRKKKGIGPRKIYFGKDVQDAIIEFNKLNDVEHKRTRQKLFQSLIYPAFKKLAENIINTFKFHNYETTFEDLQNDVISELYQKIGGYDELKGRAYSYFSQISKNFLIICSRSVINHYNSKDDILVIDDNRNFTSEMSLDDYQKNLKEFIFDWTAHQYDKLTTTFKTDRDRKIADAFFYFLKNSDDIDIYNKKMIYIFIREYANVDTIHITKVINKLKPIFKSDLRRYISN